MLVDHATLGPGTPFFPLLLLERQTLFRYILPKQVAGNATSGKSQSHPSPSSPKGLVTPSLVGRLLSVWTFQTYLIFCHLYNARRNWLPD